MDRKTGNGNGTETEDRWWVIRNRRFIAVCARKNCVLRVHYNQKEKIIFLCIAALKPQTLRPINNAPHLAQLSSPIINNQG